jgi:hypothetical protein
MASEITRIRTNRDNIRAAIASGVFQASVDSQAATFASMNDMRSILNDFNHQLAVLTKSDQRKPRYGNITMTGGT